MGDFVIAYDLGTGGIKASLFDKNGKIHAKIFEAYDTFYPREKYHEQKPMDWWNGLISTTKRILDESGAGAGDIEACAISGQSLGVVPLDSEGNVLREYTPIWSDARATEQAGRFLNPVDYQKWYETTGGGFPIECYSIFKIMWYKEHEPDMYERASKILGSKDFCNYMLTGAMKTDFSYASGSGVYDLKNSCYKEDFIDHAGVKRSLFPDIVSSHEIVGNISPEASRQTGLPQTVKVMCGGVDNSCMSLGAKCYASGRSYTSLGSSAWIAVTSDEPIIDFRYKPFVFAHVVDGKYTSSAGIFSAGSSLQWIRNNVFQDFYSAEREGGKDAYEEITALAEKSPVGANKLMFNPSLAGGIMTEEDPDIRGGFMGLTLAHNREDVARSTLEGISLNLRHALDILRRYQDLSDEMLLVGGGSKSAFWRQIFSDIFEMNIVKSNIDQDAASLGAAALAFFGAGIWDGYEILDSVHQLEATEYPEPETVKKYNRLFQAYKEISHYMAVTGKMLTEMEL